MHHGIDGCEESLFWL